MRVNPGSPCTPDPELHFAFVWLLHEKNAVIAKAICDANNVTLS